MTGTHDFYEFPVTRSTMRYSISLPHISFRISWDLRIQDLPVSASSALDTACQPGIEPFMRQEHTS